MQAACDMARAATCSTTAIRPPYFTAGHLGGAAPAAGAEAAAGGAQAARQRRRGKRQRVGCGRYAPPPRRAGVPYAAYHALSAARRPLPHSPRCPPPARADLEDESADSDLDDDEDEVDEAYLRRGLLSFPFRLLGWLQIGCDSQTTLCWFASGWSARCWCALCYEPAATQADGMPSARNALWASAAAARAHAARAPPRSNAGGYSGRQPSGGRTRMMMMTTTTVSACWPRAELRAGAGG